MIRLEVDDRCHNCPKFRPECEEEYETSLYADGELVKERVGDYVIQCGNRDLCEFLLEKARNEVKGEMKNEQDGR